jgi:hypothetical protein
MEEAEESEHASGDDADSTSDVMKMLDMALKMGEETVDCGEEGGMEPADSTPLAEKDEKDDDAVSDAAAATLAAQEGNDEDEAAKGEFQDAAELSPSGALEQVVPVVEVSLLGADDDIADEPPASAPALIQECSPPSPPPPPTPVRELSMNARKLRQNLSGQMLDASLSASPQQQAAETSTTTATSSATNSASHREEGSQGSKAPIVASDGAQESSPAPVGGPGAASEGSLSRPSVWLSGHRVEGSASNVTVIYFVGVRVALDGDEGKAPIDWICEKTYVDFKELDEKLNSDKSTACADEEGDGGADDGGEGGVQGTVGKKKEQTGVGVDIPPLPKWRTFAGVSPKPKTLNPEPSLGTRWAPDPKGRLLFFVFGRNMQCNVGRYGIESQNARAPKPCSTLNQNREIAGRLIGHIPGWFTDGAEGHCRGHWATAVCIHQTLPGRHARD